MLISNLRLRASDPNLLLHHILGFMEQTCGQEIIQHKEDTDQSFHNWHGLHGGW